jgi:broad specificity phosphatase PhoE
MIILVRHGQSQANVDKRIWRALPDNLVRLTEQGQQQAVTVGQRIHHLLEQEAKDGKEKPYRRLHLVVSPFERTLQTAAGLRQALDARIVRTDIESRIREQEMGNIQDDDFVEYRKQQQRVGRFWYRFPTGESGADVHDRVKSWWSESVLTVNQRHGFDPVDALVVVTHGLTIRFILMQLFGWSPTTFHSIWNAGNCDMYVLKRDLSKPGTSPYVLDPVQGDMPRSSINVMVQLKPKNTTPEGEPQAPPPPLPLLKLRLHNYLSVPPPRTTRLKLIAQMLADQYPTQIPHASDITHILFMPFVQTTTTTTTTMNTTTTGSNSNPTLEGDTATTGVTMMIQGRSTSGSTLDPSRHEDISMLGMCDLAKTMMIQSSSSSLGYQMYSTVQEEEDDDEESNDGDYDSYYQKQQAQKPEQSLRFPCIQMPIITTKKDKDGTSISQTTTQNTDDSIVLEDNIPTTTRVMQQQQEEEQHHKPDPPTSLQPPTERDREERGGGGLFPWWPWRNE